jgi:lipid II:glycine glycyltransferase (peptidoglycan interpeptide bridge formation enzyme)
VGVYDRKLFELPLGHLVQYSAIKEMKRRGLRWYKLGSMALPHLKSDLSEKEISISHFKEGFATHFIPYYQVSF